MESAKLIFVDWVLQVLRAITLYFLKIKAGMTPELSRNTPMRGWPPVMLADIIQDKSVVQERWDICSGCEFLTSSDSCKKCGCMMKTKVKFGKVSCPIGKWGAYKKEEINVVTAT